MSQHEELIKELGGQVSVMSKATWKDGVKTEEEWTALLPEDTLVESSGESLEDVLQKLRAAKEAAVGRPKIVYRNQFSEKDLSLLDDLITHATLLQLLEEPANDNEEWLMPRLPAILSATSLKMTEVYDHFCDRG